jgi:glycosyltransferase involved in cell wall biosynthesis
MLDLFDVYVSATGGEGFGKCSLEALSLNMPVIITDYAASTEVCAKGSILVPKVGTYRVMDQYKSVDLALIDEDKLAEQIVYLYNNPAERKELGLIAREWAAEFDYDTKVAPAWLDVLDRVNPDVVLANQLLRYSR